MYGAAHARAKEDIGIKYNDHGSRAWLWSGAPCRWRGKVELEFRDVPFRSLLSATSGRHPQVVDYYERGLRSGWPVPPPVVSANEGGTYYVHDGNHRYEAIGRVLNGQYQTNVRVAVVVPKPGFQFRWRWFGKYGTYVLEPEQMSRYRPVNRRARPGRKAAPLLGRTMVLVAHPDDESGGCAALLQRMRDPIVVFATDGAPNDEFFWGPFGSRESYGRVRRQEALRGLSEIGIRAVHFLDDYSPTQLRDQHLHRELSAALNAAEVIVRGHRPEAILVPAYEGGHPDHDACSLIGYLLGELYSIPVWEMPLYHRAASGRIVCQRFLDFDGTEVSIRYTRDEILNRSALIANYASQTDLGDFVHSRVEYFRKQRAYDYTKPPHDGVMNYEEWGWPITAAEVCLAFEHLLTDVEVRSERRGNIVPITRLLQSGTTAAGFEQTHGA
ncbi:MAG TPA: PIG-L family deacetylase [Terriglobales bacterium]|nr:PIG-L family deacetylase [Terriglobales bacterium]